jgi:chemotaxis response regulator CheB
VAVILSGTLADGVDGVRATAQSGGLTICEDPQTAPYPEMPAAAIATGCVHLVLHGHTMAAAVVGAAAERAQHGSDWLSPFAA